MMNIRYIQFVRKTTSEKQLLDSASDILVLSLNLAGASVGGAAAKTVLAGIAAGVTGSKVVVDKTFFYEKSVPALIATMNAQRKQVLIPILEGTRETLEDYPFDQAVTDLHAYYFAGTFLGAIQAIQVDAGVKDQQAQSEIVKLSRITKQDVATKQSLTDALGRLAEADLPKVHAALQAFDPKANLPASFADALDALQDRIREARSPEQIAKAAAILKTAKILQ
jgi:hypothetical protein